MLVGDIQCTLCIRADVSVCSGKKRKAASEEDDDEEYDVRDDESDSDSDVIISKRRGGKKKGSDDSASDSDFGSKKRSQLHYFVNSNPIDASVLVSTKYLHEVHVRLSVMQSIRCFVF